MPLPDADFPAAPYPGAVPDISFAHVDAESHPLRRDRGHGWTVDGTPLDDWLAGYGAVPRARRVPLLAYGSNRCPSKITWLRRALGMGDDPVVALRVRTRGLAAVWANGLRRRDGQRPAVIAAAPGVAEEHVVWLATAEQIAVLDRCEGRDERFRLARLHTGEVHTADGDIRITRPWCYVAHGAVRRPLHVDGALVRCAELPQDAALTLTGEPGEDGLQAPTVAGAPHPDEWPATLFVYGLLQPGGPSWSLVAPHSAGEPRRASVDGAVYDTGFGYPALRPGAGGRAPGWLVPVRDPAALLPVLDEYEGSAYRRERVVAADGTVCWSYAWAAPFDGFRPLPGGWPVQ